MFSGVEVVSIEVSQSELPTSDRLGKRLVARVAGVGVVAGLVAGVLPVPLAIAYPASDTRDIRPSRGDYQRCTSRLVGLKISAEEATSACARALKPSLLSECVGNITRDQGIAAADALDACRRVRSPDTLATCVVDVRRNLSGVAPADSLDYCRRTLFPERFARCVVGISSAAKSTPTQALDTCSDGGYFPREVDPTFLTYPLTSTETTAPPVLEPAPPAQQAPAPTPTPAPAKVTPQRY